MEGFDMKNYTDQIADVFSGMTEEYEKIIRGFHQVYLDDSRTKQYKSQQRASAMNAVYDLVNDRVRTAKELIESIKKEYTNPGEPPSKDASEKTYDLLYWREILPYADYKELQQYYTEHKADPLFVKMLFNEFKRREQEKPSNYSMTKQQNLIAEINKVVEFPELDKLELTLNHVANTARETFNPGIERLIRTGQGSLYPRSIKKDLEAYPIERKPGNPHRPKFSIPEQVK